MQHATQLAFPHMSRLDDIAVRDLISLQYVAIFTSVRDRICNPGSRQKQPFQSWTNLMLPCRVAIAPAR